MRKTFSGPRSLNQGQYDYVRPLDPAKMEYSISTGNYLVGGWYPSLVYRRCVISRSWWRLHLSRHLEEALFIFDGGANEIGHMYLDTGFSTVMVKKGKLPRTDPRDPFTVLSNRGP